MGLIDTIANFENSLDEENCEKCENYRNGFDGPYCTYWETEPMGPCEIFHFSEFWEKKRGY